MYEDNVVEAVAMYLRRQARLEHPQGRFDRGGRFYLSEVCGRECGIRQPTWSWPYSQMLHGRALVHCAHALGVSRREAMKLLREIRKQLQTPDEALAERLESVDLEEEGVVAQLARSMAQGRPAGKMYHVTPEGTLLPV